MLAAGMGRQRQWVLPTLAGAAEKLVSPSNCFQAGHQLGFF